MTAGPLAEHVLGEPVQPCAGYAGFVERTGRSEYGMRWRPEKWAKWIDASNAARVSPLQDYHCWLETHTHVIDFTTGDTMGESGDLWPLVYGKDALPKASPRGPRPGIKPVRDEPAGGSSWVQSARAILRSQRSACPVEN